jgi:micrococcal nuclease
MVLLLVGVALAVGTVRADSNTARTFPATIERWVDGDTAVATIDLGLDVVLTHQYLRLEGVDTPERGQPDYDRATQMSRATCPGPATLTITGKGKYGRWITTVVCSGANLNERLRAQGWRYE